MKNETICECGHLKEFHVCDARDHVYGQECPHNSWCGEDCACTAFTAAQSLRDEMFEMTESFMLSAPYDTYCIECIYPDDYLGYAWSIRDCNNDCSPHSEPFDTPEEAFAWLKDHLKEQKK